MKADQQKGFAIAPKQDCPHLNQEKVKQLIQFLLQKNAKTFAELQCNQCKDKIQNWICLQCQALGCSRYVKGHMAQHNKVTKHTIALSFSDASFWCYQCESYIQSSILRSARIQLSKSKFAQQDKPKEQQTQQEKVLKQLEKLVIQQQNKPTSFTYEQLINGFKNNSFKKVVFLIGAGLSVASGIPDFRSPKTGLYSQLEKFNLPYPQAVFQINFYKKNPQPFLRVAKQYLSGQFQPTVGHKFMKKLQDLDLLKMVLSQNIDDLQFKVGIKQQKMLQAHGHSRKAHCILCHSQASIEKFKQHLQKLQAMYCEKCKGLVKPDIIFFGQQLPKEFSKAPQHVRSADLIFVVGTSLKVVPFSFLAQMIQKTCPVVLVNNQDSMPGRFDKLWMKGDIQQNMEKIMKQMNWI